MDKTETYIKMTLALPDYMIRKLEEIGTRWFYVPAPDRTVRLFEQDQLQEMVKTDNLPYDIGSFLRHCIANVFPQDTWEQLWLAFVMFELHQKKWNGTEWIKEERK